MSEKTDQVHNHGCDLLEEFRQNFTRPHEVKLTLIARCPWLEDANIIITDDSDEGIIAALEKTRASDG